MTNAFETLSVGGEIFLSFTARRNHFQEYR